jgi:hypothetical protein
MFFFFRFAASFVPERQPVAALPPLGRADLIRSLHSLRPQGESVLDAVADMLGMSVEAPSAARAEPVTSPAPQQQTAHSPELEPEPPTGDAPLEDPLPSTLEVTDERPRTADVVPMPIESELDRPRAALRPLLRPLWSRGVITTALATGARDGPPALDEVIDVLARGRALREMPRTLVPTLRLGVQVLIDAGPGMAPFARDQEMIVRELRRVLTGDRVRLASFVGVPYPRVRTPAGWEDYVPPPCETPVLMLTDLGLAGAAIAGPDVVSEPAPWLRFADRVARAGCPLVAFVPYPPARWPAELAAAVRIVQWDHTTGVGDVRRAAPAARPEGRP